MDHLKEPQSGLGAVLSILLTEIIPPSHILADHISFSQHTSSRQPDVGLGGSVHNGTLYPNHLDSRRRQLPGPTSEALSRAQTKSQSQKSPRTTADELQFIRENRWDPDAIPVVRSIKRVELGMAGKIPGGGFQPRNTLNTTLHAPILHAQPSAVRGFDGRKRRALETQVSVGDNVEKAQQISNFDAPIPQAKRQKKRPTDHSPDPIQSSDDTVLERLSPEEYVIERVVPSQKTSQFFSSKSLGPGLYVNGHPSVNSRVEEYRIVENLMDSKCKKKAKQRGDRFRPRFPMASDTTARPLNYPSSESNPIDLSGDDGPEEGKKQRHQTLFQGTATDGAKAVLATEGVNDLSQTRDTGERSRHFKHGGKHTIQSKPLNGSKFQDGKLADQYRDTEGNRKSMHSDCSSDELDSATTVGVVKKSPERQLSPQSRSRQSSPTKPSVSAQKAMSPPENEVSVPPSIFPATTFSSSGAKRQGQNSLASKNSYIQEKQASWGISLAGISYAGEFKRSEGLGLQFDEDTQTYVILDDGKNLTSSHPSLRIQPQKLRKITWAESGGKIRFESSKTGNYDTKLDLEVQSERDSQALLARLQDGKALQVISKPRQIVEKMFAVNMKEQKRVLASPRSVVEEVPLDVRLAARNNQRRDEIKNKEGAEQSISKRPRTVLRTVDKLTGGVHQGLTSPGLYRSRTTAIFKDILGDRTSKVEVDAPNGQEDQLSTLDKMLERTQAQNSHIPRSQIATRATFRKPKELSPMLDEFPEEERYSRRIGLGPRWAKSLTYPKFGRKKTTIDWSDLERLDEGQYLNDNLIGFYLRFLEQKAEEKSPELLKKVYFFNTFFFASLTNTQRGKKLINYEGVQKWTRGIDLFTYDYVVVPINESTHWYVAIICNLPQLIHPATEEDNVLAPPQSDSGDGDETLNKVSAESVLPISGPSTLTEPQSLLDAKIGEPEEKDPTASFADMSLETDAEKSPADGPKDGELGASVGVITANGSEEKDQEMLDAQIQADIVESSIPEDAGAVEKAKTETDMNEAIAENSSPKASFSKKRKRKSVPPMKKIDATRPAIITFDSLGAPHPPTIRILKNYLREEGLAKRNGMEFDESRLKGLTAKQIPQQDNFSDCGLFLLGYMDKFLENPKEFVDKIVKREYDIKTDWPRMDPSQMRANLRTLIEKLHAEQEEERLREKREIARKAGKLVSKQPQELQPKELEPQPSSDPLNADDGHGQLTTTPSHLDRTDEADTTSGNAQTRNEALESAITIDSQEPSGPRETITVEIPIPATKAPTKPANATIPKGPSVITIDSQPSSLNPLIQPSPPESRTPSPELTSEIADSQPLVQPPEVPSSPPTLHKRPPQGKEPEQDLGQSYDGLPSASTSSLDLAIGEEVEELKQALKSAGERAKNERKETERDKLKARGMGRERRRSVVEIDD